MLVKDGLLLETMYGNVKGGWLQVEEWSRGDKWTWNKDCWKAWKQGVYRSWNGFLPNVG
jgi:hypothetical protein